uniref:CCT domain-containing protein n=1 Tax=Aegilops tauschii subsp. strangulata TaxID=200361 RepID=A0A453AIY7_AEGTS
MVPPTSWPSRFVRTSLRTFGRMCGDGLTAQSSGSGSGSGSAIQTQKCTKSKSGNDSNNNSNNRNDDASMGLNARDGSDNGSGTQTSWTKRAVEIDSPQDMSPDQSVDPPDSTCAHVSHLKSEICSNRLRGTNNKKCQKPTEFKGKELEIGAPGNLNTEDQSSPNESSVKPADNGRCEYLPQNNSNDTVMENSDEPIVRAADLIGSMAKNMDAQQAARAIDAPNCSSQAPQGKDTDRENAMPYLELSLKRSRSTADGADAAIQEEQRNVVRRSDLSAFTRYNTCAVSNQGGAGFVGSCSPNGNSSEAAKTDAAQMKQGSNGSSNNNDMGSTTKSVVTKPAGGNNKVSPINGNTHTSAFHRVQPWTPATAAGKDKADEMSKKNAATAAAAKDNGGEAQSKRPCAAAHDTNGGSSAGGTAQSNVVNPSGPVEGHAANYGSNSGSNNNTNNGSTAATAAAAVHAETGGIDKRSNMMHMKRERRVAAVNKFREKRKERNFGKKVRYQSRKRLAEQRPRVRGQFVRQPPPPAAVER